jgi:hypothetical protein
MLAITVTVTHRERRPQSPYVIMTLGGHGDSSLTFLIPVLHGRGPVNVLD